MFKTVAVVVAAGRGKRMGAEINKQYLNFIDKPILAHTLEVFEKHSLIDGMIIVTHRDEVSFCYEKVIMPFRFKKVITVVAGGKERQDSVYQGLTVLPPQCELVVVHDGARPLITPDIITEAVTSGQKEGAVIVAVPVKDTIKKVANEFVTQTVSREELWTVQTPQVFKKELILEAYKNAFNQGIYGTDDASLVEILGKRVKVVPGSYENLKITTPEDLDIGEAILARRSRGSN